MFDSSQIYGLKKLVVEQRSFCDLTVFFGNIKAADSHHWHF